MLSTNLRLGAWIAAALLLGSSPSGAADVAQLYKSVCASCHGVEGNGNQFVAAPPLAGSDAEYLARQLRHLKSKVRGGANAEGASAGMQAVASSLSDSDITELARYAAAFPALPARSEPATPAMLKSGQALFAVCAACHSARGEGKPALSAPRINHLPNWYIAAQLQGFRSGARGGSADEAPAQQMRQALAALTDDKAVQNVSAYAASIWAPGR